MTSCHLARNLMGCVIALTIRDVILQYRKEPGLVGLQRPQASPSPPHRVLALNAVCVVFFFSYMAINRSINVIPYDERNDIEQGYYSRCVYPIVTLSICTISSVHQLPWSRYTNSTSLSVQLPSSIVPPFAAARSIPPSVNPQRKVRTSPFIT